MNNAQVNLLRQSGNTGLGLSPGVTTLFPIPLKNNDLVFQFVALGDNTIIVSLIGIFATFLGFFMGLAQLGALRRFTSSCCETP